MLTLYQFNTLETDAKAVEVWENGVRLADRIDGIHKVLLYQLYSFYVEVWYNQNEICIDALRSFSSTTPLEPYLEHIDLEGLLQ